MPAFETHIEEMVLSLLIKSHDCYISVNPSLMLNRTGVLSKDVTNRISILRDTCKHDKHRRKYEEIIRALSFHKKYNKPNKDDLLGYKLLLKSKKDK